MIAMKTALIVIMLFKIILLREISVKEQQQCLQQKVKYTSPYAAKQKMTLMHQLAHRRVMSNTLVLVRILAVCLAEVTTWINLLLYHQNQLGQQNYVPIKILVVFLDLFMSVVNTIKVQVCLKIKSQYNPVNWGDNR